MRQNEKKKENKVHNIGENRRGYTKEGVSTRSNGKYYHVGQKKRFKDTLKTSLKSFGVDTWDAAAQNRIARPTTLRKGAEAYEESRTLDAEQRKTSCDIKTHMKRRVLVRSVQEHRALIGLTSHIRTRETNHGNFKMKVR